MIIEIFIYCIQLDPSFRQKPTLKVKTEHEHSLGCFMKIGTLFFSLHVYGKPTLFSRLLINKH